MPHSPAHARPRSLGLLYSCAQNSIGSYNGLVPNRQYAITRSNNDTVHWHMISSITLDYTHWFPICVTGTLCGEFTGEFHPQRPATRSFDVFFDLRLIKRLSKQLRRRWFEMPSHSSWCQSSDSWYTPTGLRHHDGCRCHVKIGTRPSATATLTGLWLAS